MNLYLPHEHHQLPNGFHILSKPPSIRSTSPTSPHLPFLLPIPELLHSDHSHTHTEEEHQDQDQEQDEPDEPRSFTVVVRGTEFELSRAQIDFDSPNLFSSSINSPSHLSTSPYVLRIDRNPLLFQIILEYLSGYEILPLQKDALPITMGLTAGLINLERDAAFFGLVELGRKIGKLREVEKKWDLRVLGYNAEVLDWSDMQHGTMRFDLGQMDEERTYLRPGLVGQLQGESYVFIIRNAVLRFRSGGVPYYGSNEGEVLVVQLAQAPDGLPLPPRANRDRLFALLSDLDVDYVEDKCEVDGIQGSVGALWRTFTGHPWAADTKNNNPFRSMPALPFRTTGDNRDADYLTLLAQELFVSVDYAEEVEQVGFDSAARIRLHIRYGRFVTMGAVRAKAYKAPATRDCESWV